MFQLSKMKCKDSSIHTVIGPVHKTQGGKQSGDNDQKQSGDDDQNTKANSILLVQLDKALGSFLNRQTICSADGDIGCTCCGMTSAHSSRGRSSTSGLRTTKSWSSTRLLGEPYASSANTSHVSSMARPMLGISDGPLLRGRRPGSNPLSRSGRSAAWHIQWYLLALFLLAVVSTSEGRHRAVSPNDREGWSYAKHRSASMTGKKYAVSPVPRYTTVVYGRTTRVQPNLQTYRWHPPRHQAGGRVYEWSAWGAATACTRTCGAGVKHRKRHCLKTSGEVTRQTSSTLCRGGERKFELCNTQDCRVQPDDFRQRQCTAQDRKLYRGRRYRWKPYERGSLPVAGFGPCALVCTTRDQHYTLTVKFAGSVADGTRCEARGGNRGACLAGKCVSLGCDMRLYSQRAYDGCGVCGGQNTTCHTVSDIINKHITLGYNRVLTLPPHARHVVVTEMDGSSAVFALRNDRGIYFVNGRHSMSYPTVYSHVGGTTFYYHHPLYDQSGLEKLVAHGPTNETLYVLMLSPEAESYIRLEYRYTVPLVEPSGASVRELSASPQPTYVSDVAYNEHLLRLQYSPQGRKPWSAPLSHFDIQRRYLQKSLANTTLSPDAGKSSGAKTVHGNHDKSNEYGNSTALEDNLYPGVDNVTLQPGEVVPSETTEGNRNEQKLEETPYYWHTSMAAACSATCTNGVHVAFAQCFRRKNNKQVEDRYCEQDMRPPLRRFKCEGQPCNPRWVPSTWSKCSVSCGEGQQFRSTRCYRMMAPGFDSSVHEAQCYHLERPHAIRDCTEVDCGPLWEASQWSECSSKCGHGIQTRDVRCGSEDCDPATKHVGIRHCNSGPCTNKWVVSGWSKVECSGPCGSGVIQRSVTCRDRDGQFLHDKHCDQNRRPLSIKACGTEPDCPPVWVAQDWGVCSVACGVGMTTRRVVCAEVVAAEFKLQPDGHCKHLLKPDTRGRCREKPCQAKWYTTDWSQCSQTCGTNGVRVRKVNCYLDNKTSLSCETDDRPAAKERCILPPCGGQTAVTTCEDDGKTDCNLVVEYRLCAHWYYRQACCQTCLRIVNNNHSSATVPSTQTDDVTASAQKPTGHDRDINRSELDYTL